MAMSDTLIESPGKTERIKFGATIKVDVQKSVEKGVIPRLHGASAQMSKTIREGVVPVGGVNTGGNPPWGREMLRGEGAGMRLDFENLWGHNLLTNK